MVIIIIFFYLISWSVITLYEPNLCFHILALPEATHVPFPHSVAVWEGKGMIRETEVGFLEIKS